MRYLFTLLILCYLLPITRSSAQTADTLRAGKQWNAQWIGSHDMFDNGHTYGVYYFRKHIDLATKPATFYVHISADNRYKLIVNGRLVSIGPAKGDFYNWNYETINLAPYLKAGSNLIAAMVWNEADYRPEWQITLRTSFIIQGNSAAEEIINTNKSWKCIQDKAFSPFWGFFIAINGEKVDMNQTISNWYAADLDDNSWPNAGQLFGGQPKGFTDGFGYMLVPSPLPARELTPQPISVIRKVTGIQLKSDQLGQALPITVPANTKAVILLDQTYETNAYPTIKFSGGKNAGISISYAESLFDNLKKYQSRKSNRNEIEGKDFSGLTDSLTSNGTPGQSFTPFNFRTFRYIRLTVTARDEPVTIDSLAGTFTAYPFKQTAVFNSNNPEITKILDIGWRTARLNAFETYTDCPYYEQLQYIGDTRIQAMVSYYYSGDDRLARHALDLMDESRLSEGMTLSRYPSHTTQIISPFSLWYIGMLHDYFMYRHDNEFLKDKLPGERGVLAFFAKHQKADGSLANTPYWNFVDWASGKDWGVGAPPVGTDGSSAIIDLQLLWAYQWGAEMESAIGSQEYAALYQKKIAQLKQTIRAKYWDAAKGIYADTKDKLTFSQHCNSLAMLTGLVPDAEKLSFSKKLLSDTGLTQATIYFKYYLHQALVKGGLGDGYQTWLGAWRDNIAMGLTTWAEYSDLHYSRSDCHAWGSSPNIEYFRTVLGIDSYAPGFQKIKIEPHLGDLTNVSGEIPHPDGKVAVSYSYKNGHWKIDVRLPGTTSGILKWKAKIYPLKAGSNSFEI